MCTWQWLKQRNGRNWRVKPNPKKLLSWQCVLMWTMACTMAPVLWFRTEVLQTCYRPDLIKRYDIYFRHPTKFRIRRICFWRIRVSWRSKWYGHFTTPVLGFRLFVRLNIYILTSYLIHWGRDEMAAIFQTTISHAFSSMKINKFRLRFHWSLFPRVQLTVFQHWFG